MVVIALSGGACSLRAGIDTPDLNVSCDSDLCGARQVGSEQPLGEKSLVLLL